MKEIPSTGSRKTCMMKAVLIGLMTFCLSVCADTLSLEFGTVRADRAMKTYFDENGTLCIEIRDPFPVQVTIDAVDYYMDGKHYSWDVSPREFYFTGKTTVPCNATLYVDGVSEDRRRVLFVPWVKIDVSNVVLHSPNPEKGWPYDPVYDDPIWEMTVRGSLSDAAAHNGDKAPVSYTLNKPATRVEIVPYKSTWLGMFKESAGASFPGTGNKGRNKVDAWIINNQDEGDGYYVEVTAYGDYGRPDDVDKDNSQEVGIVREKYYMQSNPPEHPDEMDVSLVAPIGPSDNGTGLKIIGSIVTVVGLYPPASIPSAIISLALTWMPSSVPSWNDDHCMLVLHGPWQMSMHTWEGSRYVVKDDDHYYIGGYSFGERGTFNVCHERGYDRAWYAWVCEHREMPGHDLPPSDVSEGLSASPVFDGFLSNYHWSNYVDPEGMGSGYHSSEADGPTLGEEFFTQRKVLAPLLKWDFPHN